MSKQRRLVKPDPHPSAFGLPDELLQEIRPNIACADMEAPVREGKDFYHYSSYMETDPEHFKRRLPVRGQKGYPKGLQSSKKSEVIIPVSYPDIPRLSEWP